MERDRYDIEILNAYDDAQAKLPADCQSRLDRALLIALTGLVLQRNDHHRVGSQTKDEVLYRVSDVNCECKDSRAPVMNGTKMCKHQMSVRLITHARHLHSLWQSEATRVRTDPMPQNLQRLTILSCAAYNATVSIKYKNGVRHYREVTRASIDRINDLCLKARYSKHWEVRPFSLADIGWVLQRVQENGQ